MKSLTVIFVVAALFPAVALSGCDLNPLLDQFYDAEMQGRKINTDPIPAQDGGCPLYKAKASCCDDQVVDAQEGAIASITSGMELVKEYFKSLTPESLQEIVEEGGDEDVSLPFELYEDVVGAVKKAVDPIFVCLETLFGVYRGGLCYSCEADLEGKNYISKKDNVFTIKADSSTCNDAIKFCTPMTKALNYLKNDLCDAGIKYMKSLNIPESDEEEYVTTLKAAKGLEICALLTSFLNRSGGQVVQASCDSFICKDLIGLTLGAEPTMDRMLALSNGGTETASLRIKNSVKIQVKNIVRSIFSHKMRRFTGLDLTEKIDSVEYVDGGFPVLSSGCGYTGRVGVKCPEKVVDFKPNGKNRGRVVAVVVLFLLIIGVAAAAGMVFYKRRQASLAQSRTYSRFENHILEGSDNISTAQEQGPSEMVAVN